MGIIYLFGVGIAFFLALLLLGKKGKHAGDVLMIIWLAITGLHVLLFYAHSQPSAPVWPHLLGLSIPMPLLQGPLLYFYTAAMTGQLPSRRARWIHVLPVIAVYGWLSPFLVSPVAYKVFVFQHDGAGYAAQMQVIWGMIVLSGVGYVAGAVWLLFRYRKRLMSRFSSVERVNRTWLRSLIGGIAGIWLLVLLGNDTWVFGGAVAYVLFIGYFGIRQAGILGGMLPGQANAEPLEEAVEAEAAISGEVSAPERKKYERSGLSEAAANALHQSVRELMDREQLYRNSELTLADLATALGVHPNYVSQVINDREGHSFYDFVNIRRVEAFKHMVAAGQAQKFTLLSLAFECGFNSKTTFNRYFRKVTGVSPSEYLQQATGSAPEAE